LLTKEHVTHSKQIGNVRLAFYWGAFESLLPKPFLDCLMLI